MLGVGGHHRRQLYPLWEIGVGVLTPKMRSLRAWYIHWVKGRGRREVSRDVQILMVQRLVVILRGTDASAGGNAFGRRGHVLVPHERTQSDRGQDTHDDNYHHQLNQSEPPGSWRAASGTRPVICAWRHPL